jgi:hypothetical protein
VSLVIEQLPDVEWRWNDARIPKTLLAEITAGPVDSVELVCALIQCGAVRMDGIHPVVNLDIWENGEMHLWAADETFGDFVQACNEERAAQIMAVCDRHGVSPSLEWPCVWRNHVLREAFLP